jgi:hypothetical protein
VEDFPDEDGPAGMEGGLAAIDVDVALGPGLEGKLPEEHGAFLEEGEEFGP